MLNILATSEDGETLEVRPAGPPRLQLEVQNSRPGGELDFGEFKKIKRVVRPGGGLV